MKIVNEITSLEEFDAWSGAIDTKQTIIDNGKGDAFITLMEEIYPEGLSDVQLNDMLWFDSEYLFDMLEIIEE